MEKQGKLYLDNYPKVTKMLAKYQDPDTQMPAEKLAQMLKGLVYLTQDHLKMSPEIQQQCPLQPLFVQFFPYMNIVGPESKPHVLKIIFQIYNLIPGNSQSKLLQKILKTLLTDLKDMTREEPQQFEKVLKELLSMQWDTQGPEFKGNFGLFLTILKHMSTLQVCRVQLKDVLHLVLKHFQEDQWLAFSGLLRNMVSEPQSIPCVTVIPLCLNYLKQYQEEEIVLNLIRVFGKLSLEENNCLQMHKDKGEDILLKLFQKYRRNNYIVLRVAFILANMVSYIETLRGHVYTSGFGLIFEALVHYANTQPNQQPSYQLGQSTAVWDFKAISKENTDDVLVKLLRLLANLFTNQENGKDFLLQQKESYKKLLKICKVVMEKDMEKNKEIINCAMSVISNIAYFEKGLLMVNDFEMNSCKQDILNLLPNYIVQLEFEELCLEGLRIIANFCRQKDYLKHLKSLKIIDVLLVLLGHSIKDVVFYASGALVNIFNDEDLKQTYQNTAVEGCLQVIQDCTVDENDLLYNSLMVLSKVSQKTVPLKLLKQMQVTLENLAQICAEENAELAQLINQIMHQLPVQDLQIYVLDCGRLFKNEQELINHKKRRHVKILDKMPHQEA